MGLELWEKSSSTHIFLYLKSNFKKNEQKCMNQKEIDWQQKFQKKSYGEANEPSAFRDKHNI